MAQFLGAGSSSAVAPDSSLYRLRPFTGDEIPVTSNYGSSEEESEDEEDDSAPTFIARTLRPYADFEDDKYLLDAAPPGSSYRKDFPFKIFYPKDMYYFEWCSLTKPPVPEEERREPFTHVSGPTAEYETAYDAFTAIFDRTIMEKIALETNRYAHQTYTSRVEDTTVVQENGATLWKDTDVDELYVFIGIVLATSICFRSDHWTSDCDVCSTPNFSLYMDLNRFELLSRFLHFSNNDISLTELTRQEARIFKITPIVEHLNKKFQELYSVGQNIVIDESIIQWKGWYDAEKRIKVKEQDFKTYEICDSSSGYLWKFIVRAGKTEKTSPEEAPVLKSIPDIVLELINGLPNKGHTIWMDNYYNSPSLARLLKALGFDCVGTLSMKRQFIPDRLNTLLRTEIIDEGRIHGASSDDVDILVWQNLKPISLITTYHGAAICSYKDKPMPTAMRDYYVNMAAVDKKDKILGLYPIEWDRTKVWYKKFFKKLLNVSVLNAYILRNYSKPNSISRYSEFRWSLNLTLLGKHSKNQPLKPKISQTGLSQNVLDHFLEEYDFLPHSTQRRSRPCFVCRKFTKTYCSGCNLPLCVSLCNKEHHTY